MKCQGDTGCAWTTLLLKTQPMIKFVSGWRRCYCRTAMFKQPRHGLFTPAMEVTKLKHIFQLKRSQKRSNSWLGSSVDATTAVSATLNKFFVGFLPKRDGLGRHVYWIISKAKGDLFSFTDCFAHWTRCHCACYIPWKGKSALNLVGTNKTVIFF